MKLQEQAKYEKMWSIPDYRKFSPGETLVHDAIKELALEFGDSVIDLGCGTGRAAQYFKDLGFYVVGVDFAHNCLDPQVDITFRKKCLWEDLGLTSDYGFCTDVMEHIPPEYVDQVLQVINKTVAKSTYFQIACHRDSYGRKINDTLHLTVETPEWWVKKMQEHFDDVRVVKRQSSKVILVCQFKSQ